MTEWITRTARKNHICSFCGNIIPANSYYKFVRLTPWDHPDNEIFFSWKVHPFCLEVWNNIGPVWGYEWCDDYGEFIRVAKYIFPNRIKEYPWLTI
jgi:hypothetical protein